MIHYEELEKLAALAKLSLDGEDEAALAQEIGRILDFAATIAGAPVPNFPDEDEIQQETSLRPDTASPSLPAEQLLSGAGEQRDGYFVARDSQGGRHE